jgi:hypothetical protein
MVTFTASDVIHGLPIVPPCPYQPVMPDFGQSTSIDCCDGRDAIDIVPLCGPIAARIRIRTEGLSPAGAASPHDALRVQDLAAFGGLSLNLGAQARSD